MTEYGHAEREDVMTGPDILDMPRKLAVLAARSAAKSNSHVVGWYADPSKAAYAVTRTVERILGRPTNGFAQWAR
ncbi:hypothetical protein AB0L25_05055 [Spirillospora sp. NPDC052242]